MRVHREHRYLRRIFKQLRRLARKVGNLHLLISVDRPSGEVAARVTEEQFNANDHYDVTVIDSPKIVTEAGCNWMGVLQETYSRFRSIYPFAQACALWDDDMILSDDMERELRAHLRDLRHDRVEALTQFLWDDELHWNAGFPAHWSAFLFRVYPGDQYPTNYVVHCPDRVAKSAKHTQFKAPLVNFGYVDPKLRPLIFQRAKESGRIDAHTLTLVKPPNLQPLTHGHSKNQPPVN
jgi:hypothetical protein